MQTRQGTVAAGAALLLLLSVVVGTARASSPPSAASGTFTQAAHTGFELRVAGPNTFVGASTVGFVSGTLSGTFEDSIDVTIRADGRFTARGTITCQCTVAGKAGILELVVVDVGQQVSPTASTFHGSAVIRQATGELAGIRGVFGVTGMVDLQTGLSSWTYSGQLHVRS